MIAALLALYLAVGDRAVAEQRPRSALVITQSHGSGAFFGEIFSSIHATLNSGSSPVTLYRENLEVNWSISSRTSDESLFAHLKTKYSAAPPDVIVAVGAVSLCYATQIQELLPTRAPVVFTLVDEPTFRTMLLPPDATGVLMNFGLAEMVRAARILVPNLKHVAIVGEVFREQPVFRYFASEIPAATKGLEVIDLAGLPMSALRDRVSSLPEETAILYTAIYSDGRGTRISPAEAFNLVAEVANRPIVVPTENLVGRGIGGFVLDPSVIGERAGALVLRLFAGEQAATIPAKVENVIKPVFDWAQLQRWKVDPAWLPPGSAIRNRPASLWEQHAWLLSMIAAAFIALTGLVIRLLQERRTRFAAEVAANERMSELAHINRHATAGEMSAAIAHELNQPLGAILNNVETASILLESGSPDMAELKTLLADIRRDDERAGEIIRGLRTLVSKRMVNRERADLNQIAHEALAIAGIQARSLNITLHDNVRFDDLPVDADPVQLQQVILNLAINAIEAVNERPAGPRDIVVRTGWADNLTAEFLISDFGPGIPADRMSRIFDPFFTTKPNGMGMGLSLARTIIEAHDGKLWAENAITGGAVFRFRLPLALTPERG